MDILDDLFSDSPAVKVARKFQPKVKARPKKASLKPAQSIEEQQTPANSSLTKTKDIVGLSKAPADSNETPAPDVSTIQNERETPHFPDVSFASSSPFRPCTSQTPQDFPMPSTKDIVGLSKAPVDSNDIPAADVLTIPNETETPDFPDVSFASSSPFRPCTSQTAQDFPMPLTYEDSGDFQIDAEQLEAGDFSCLDIAEMMNEPGTTSGKKASKFKPKPKAQDRVKNVDETLSHLPDAPQLSSYDQPVIDGSVYIEGPINNSSQAGIDGNLSMNPATDQSQDVVFEDTDPLVAPDELQQRGNDGKFDDLNSAGNTPDEGPVLSGVEVNEKGHDFFSGTNDGSGGSCKSPTKDCDALVSNREENDSNHLEEEIPKKKRGRKPKNAASGNDKPARKRKKASQEPDQTIIKPPKKFPHATRRKRCVDKSLLEIPEDELDLQKVPMKGLIFLGEHREREAKKQVAAAPVSTNKRNDNMQWEDSPYHDDGLEFDQDKDFSDIPSTSGIRTDTGYYNYHTYRKPQARAKWSKKDTELFYQGIRQFGTDLSMIQQLFPGRSLEQIRSKYRKEQKQNPMMMDDAQTSRATDHTCFERVLKTLKAAREAEEREYASSEDGLGHPTDQEGQPEQNNETDAIPQETAKPEQNLQDEEGDEEPDKAQVGSPAISYDEDDIWNTYTGM